METESIANGEIFWRRIRPSYSHTPEDNTVETFSKGRDL
jgi:hypothetical protein